MESHCKVFKAATIWCPAMKKSTKEVLVTRFMPFLPFLQLIGFDISVFLMLRYYPRFKKQKRLFQKLGGNITHNSLSLSDYNAKAGESSGHYFHQDLLVASFVHGDDPQRHIDIGSRIDGFVAHVASFRKIEVMDLRDLDSSIHKNISFIKADLMDANSAQPSTTDSISCLHAIEHFGLGRYGDNINPNGHIEGFKNIVRMLKPNGVLYISFPIGRNNQVHFNKERVFHLKDIFRWDEGNSNLILERFDYVDDVGDLHLDIDLNMEPLDVVHGCGIYTFRKMH